jgi:hypothetical protein
MNANYKGIVSIVPRKINFTKSIADFDSDNGEKALKIGLLLYLNMWS